MKLIEQIKSEDETECYISIDVKDDGTISYDKAHWAKVEPKIRAGWAKSVNVFDVLCTVYLAENGWIEKFSLEVEKKKPGRSLKVRMEDVEIEVQGVAVVAEIGGIVNKNINDVIKDIRCGYLPMLLESFEGSELVKLKVDVAFAQLEVQKLKFELELAEHRLTETLARVKEFKAQGGN